ncbi:Vacuolar protein sorting-associated protein VTA1 -like protein, partial [Trichinella sp. T9]
MRSFRVPSVPVPEFRLRWLTMTDGKTSMRELPVSYGSLSPFLKLAAKFRSYNIIGEYWCLKYVLQRLYRMKIYSKECLDFAFSLMSYVEQLRLEFPLIIPLADKRSAAPFVLCEATRMFERADTFDRHARYSVSLVQLYMQASNLFTVLSMLCELDDIAIKIQKYCKWRAWYLFNCFKNGETPLPAPKSVMLHLDSFQSDEERLQCPWKHEEIIPLGVKIGLPIQFWNFFSECEEHCVFFDMLVERFGHFNVVYKLCKSAMHALENDNEEDVIDKLERALRLAILIKCGIKACCVVFFEYVIRFVVILFISIFLNFATDMNKVIRFIWEDRFMEDATVCFGSKDAVLSLSHSDLDEGSSESLYQCDEWTSKKGKREKKDKGYCYLHRLSSEEQLVHIRPKPKKTVFGKLKDKNKEKDKEKEKEQKSKSKSKQKCKNKAETVAPAAPARPVFAVPLARALCNNPSYDRVPVPAFVRRCIDYINENALDQEGLYRVSPSVEELRNAVDNGEEPSFGDAYQAACLLKLFIRELPESLFTEELLDKFEHAAQSRAQQDDHSENVFHIATAFQRVAAVVECFSAESANFVSECFTEKVTDQPSQTGVALPGIEGEVDEAQVELLETVGRAERVRVEQVQVRVAQGSRLYRQQSRAGQVEQFELVQAGQSVRFDQHQLAVVVQMQRSQRAERGEGVVGDVGELVPSQIQRVEFGQAGELVAVDVGDVVAGQIELAQASHGGERVRLDRRDQVDAQVEHFESRQTVEHRTGQVFQKIPRQIQLDQLSERSEGVAGQRGDGIFLHAQLAQVGQRRSDHGQRPVVETVAGAQDQRVDHRQVVERARLEALQAVVGQVDRAQVFQVGQRPGSERSNRIVGQFEHFEPLELADHGWHVVQPAAEYGQLAQGMRDACERAVREVEPLPCAAAEYCQFFGCDVVGLEVAVRHAVAEEVHFAQLDTPNVGSGPAHLVHRFGQRIDGRTEQTVNHRPLLLIFCRHRVAVAVFSGVHWTYISPLRPASGKSLPTDPKAILEELAKQEFLLSHLHDEINSGINDPQKEEQLWDVQRLVTQLKRELKSLKKKNIDAFNEVEQESGPCIEMFEEKQLLAVHMDLRNKIEIQRAQIEELMRQMDDIGGQHAVLSARSVARFSDAELSPEKKFDPKWPEQYSALEDRKRELIESIFAVDTLHCKQYTTYNYTECIYCHSHYYYYYGYITTTVAKIQASSCTILEHTILITLQFSFCNFD